MENKEYKNKEFTNSGAGVLFICPSTKRILLTLRSKEVNEPLTWAGFGGKIDPEDETAESAARREVEEETGYSKNYPMYFLNSTTRKIDSFKYYTFIGIVKEEFEPNLNWENLEAKWFCLSHLKTLNLHPGFKALLKVHYSDIASYLYSDI